MMNCIIVDDEPLACDVLQNHLRKVDYVHLSNTFYNAPNALTFLQNNNVDLLFLDIQMPEMTGIELLKTLQQPPLTIFTTAYRDYAFEGYELGVIDFLLKPVSFARFVQSIEKVKDFLALKEQNTLLEKENDVLGSVFVKSGVQKIKLNFDEVTHIQGLKDYAIIYHLGGKVVIKGSIKSMHDIFPEKHFMRVHKSFIVAKNKIFRIEKNKIILKNFHIPVGRNYKEELEKFTSGKN
ncbi:MAG TPA: LytTR family DNA-binding domain-containing protein [Agriterribacter sp.]|nr:LytTR family DNA-binding domain-containing protein [Agriterribacter sp.]